MSDDVFVVNSTPVIVSDYGDGTVESEVTLTEYSDGSVTFSDESGSVFRTFKSVSAARRWLDNN